MNSRILVSSSGLALLALCSVFSSGCASVATETELDRAPLTYKLEPQDVRRTVEKMVDSLCSDPCVAEAKAANGGQRPVLDVAAMQNRTSQHVDMVSITDSIRTKLLRSRLFRFMDHTTAQTDMQFMDDQAHLGLTDQSKAVRAGQQSAAQLYLYGALTEIQNRRGRTVDEYYKFTLNLKDLKTGEIVWSDEQEIRKQQTRAAVGL